METDDINRAKDFAASYNVTVGVAYLGHFPRLDAVAVAQFSVVIHRKNYVYAFDYASSIRDSWKHRSIYRASNKFVPGLPTRLPRKMYPTTDRAFSIFNYQCKPFRKAPTAYDILAGLTKSDPGTFRDFCENFGYNSDSIKDRETYRTARKEWLSVNCLFNDCIEELQEIN